MQRLKGPQRREQLMEVATRLFAERGFDATTTAAIADAAGITEPVLYRHFQGKKELFKAILTEATDKMLAHWKRAIDSIPDPDEQFRRMGEFFGTNIREMHLSHRVVQGALTTGTDPDVKDLLHQHFDEFVSLLADLIRRGQQARTIRADVDPVAAAWVLIHIGTGNAMIGLGLDHDDTNAQMAVDLAMHGLRAN